MRQNDGVCPAFDFSLNYWRLADHKVVFRVAHDSAKETRIWAGEAKKR